jgi:hypothetical protein
LTFATLAELRELYDTLGNMGTKGWPTSYTFWGQNAGGTNKNLATGGEASGTTTTQRYGACVRIQP